MRFVTVHATDDPILAEAIVQVLRAEGVSARLLGTRNAALIGVAPHILELRIEVPRSEAELADELVEAFLTAHPAHPNDPAMREWEPDVPRLRRRSAVLAGGASFILPGGSHFYAHRPATAAVLALGIVGAFAVIVTSGWARVSSSCAALALAGLVVCDLVGGQRAVRAWNRGARVPVGRQLATGLLLVAATVCGAMLVGPRLPTRSKVDRSSTRAGERGGHPFLLREPQTE